MDFDLTEDQQEIKRTARDLLTARSPMGKVREAAESGAYDAELWRELCELGWPGLAIAEEHGGGGLGAVDTAVLLEELGYACAATPALATMAAAMVIQQAGSPGQQERWLPGLASGEQTAGLVVRGVGVDVADAAVLVVVEEDQTRLLARGDAEVEPTAMIDPTRHYARVSGTGEPLPGDSTAAADRVRAAIAAEVVGLSQRALDMTVAYVKERKQFELPVGAFQAVAHKCAQMLRDTESVRSAAYFAAWAADADPERLAEAAALAAAAGASAAKDVTGDAIQAHGGIGFTWEADVHWLYKRAQLDAALLGGAARHRAALVRMAAERLLATA